jgi:hypothetical protein
MWKCSNIVCEESSHWTKHYNIAKTYGVDAFITAAIFQQCYYFVSGLEL